MGVHDFTLFDGLARGARLFGGRPALIFEGVRLSHADLLSRAETLAAGLRRAGVAAGDRIAVLAQNRVEILDLLFACARLGAILVPVNWRMSPEEIAFVVEDAGPVLVFAEPDHAASLAELRARLTSVRGWYGFDGAADLTPHGELIAGPAPDEPPAPEVAGRDGLVIIHTAAVGGRPRGALLSHANLTAANAALAESWRLGPDDVALGILPLFHISGLGLALASLSAGGACMLMRRFDPAGALEAIARERVTVLHEFAPILGQILDAAEGRPEALASLRAVWGLDAPETISRFERTCPEARFWSGFGQSETSGFVTLGPARDRPGSAGRPLPGVALAILDDEDRPLTDGQVGEIGVRGPLVFSGYWGLEADTATTFRAGWHHTGDLGRVDPDGTLHYAGRSPAKELIKSGGENVYPAEVERVLLAHPAVAEAVVIGVPDPHWGESVKAVCRLGPEGAVAAEELAAFVGDRIARYKRPRSWTFVDALPRTAAGAVDRAAVRREHGAP